jgi:hypothetical protein
MTDVFTFSMNDWISVKVPTGLEGQELFYASTYALLTREKGIAPQKARVIAEAATMKRLYPGLMYGSVLERDLQLIRD